MKDRLILIAYLLGWWIVRTLPEKMAYSLFWSLGEFFHKRNGKSIQRLRSNLHVVNPKLDELKLETLVAQSMTSYMRYWCDTFRIQNWSRERILGTVTTTNEELLLNPMKDGRGVVIALPCGCLLLLTRYSTCHSCRTIKTRGSLSEILATSPSDGL